MDARLHPSQAFGLALGDAHVIRNAGGNAKDAIRSLVISEQLLGTKAIFLVKHTGMCEADSIPYPFGAISWSWEHGFWISALVVNTINSASTDCGMLTFENKDIHAEIQKNLNVSAENIDFQPFKE